MTAPVPETPTPEPAIDRQALIVGVALSVVYGLLVRLVIEWKWFGDSFGVMSLAYIVVVPLVVGFLAVRNLRRPSWWTAILMPWLPMGIATLVTAIIGYEGAICIIMALPIIMVNASIGGVLAALLTRRRLSRRTTATMSLLPLALGLVEGRVPAPYDIHAVQSSIVIAAPAHTVWREIISVREIARAEMPGNPVFLRMGFPRPLSAEIDREAVGGIRKARFAGGVLFLETVTDLQVDTLLSFRIRAQTDSIPKGTLDDHVTIGGPYFDVLQGTYRIEPLGTDSVRLRLESRLRVSTHFNWYASSWADLVMGSIQRNILAVEKRRAESVH